jgi:hypothetical protein
MALLGLARVGLYASEGPATRHITAFDKHGKRLGAIHPSVDPNCPR